MQETTRFCPEIVAWWPKLMGTGGRLGRVHRWEAAGRGPEGEVHGLEQHHTDTLVLCLGGVVRIEDGRDSLDLAAGDALILRPGTWHRHASLRRGALVYQQGVVGGRSDFFLADPGLRVVASWPEQPAWNLLAAVGEAAVETDRRLRLAALLAHLGGEIAEPMPALHPAVQAMEKAIWKYLHRPDAVRLILAAAGVSRVQAYRLAARHWGMGIASVVRGARLDLARAFIDGGMAVGEAARRSGIPERSVFTRAFRRRWGKAPSRLRAITASSER